MNKHRILLFVSMLAGLACVSNPAVGAQFILQTVPGANIGQITAQHGLLLMRPISGDLQNVYLVSAADPVSPLLTQQVEADPAVVDFDPDTNVDSHDIPPAPVINVASLMTALQNSTPIQYYGATVRSAYVQQPAATLIRLPDALQAYGSGSGTVAVIDTGVDPSHPALQGVLVPGYDFTRDQQGIPNELADLTQSTVAILDQSTVAILDSKQFAAVLNQSTVAILDQSTVAILDSTNLPSDFGHGTMVAGLIHLVAPTARIMPLKAFNANGTANLSNIVSAIYYAVDHQATVINMSFSSLTSADSLTAAMQYAASHGVICIASAGNDGREERVYPAASPYAVGVASTSPLDRRSFFSNYGEGWVRMAAPGEAMITTYPGNNYAGVWGTSFSTALVSGTVALLNQVNPSMIKDAAHALRHGHYVDMESLGNTRLDVYASILYYLQNP